MANTHPRKAQHQARKATLLANVLAAHGATAAQAGALPDEGRRTAEQLAGVSVSSDETWAMVVGILGSREAAKAHEAACWVRDELWDRPGAGALRVA